MILQALKTRRFINNSRNATTTKWLRKQAEFDEKLWFSHQTLINAVVDLYSKQPYAATELRQIATKTLGDPAEVKALMKRIEANGALKDDPIPEKTNPATPNK